MPRTPSEFRCPNCTSARFIAVPLSCIDLQGVLVPLDPPEHYVSCAECGSVMEFKNDLFIRALPPRP